VNEKPDRPAPDREEAPDSADNYGIDEKQERKIMLVFAALIGVGLFIGFILLMAAFMFDARMNRPNRLVPQGGSRTDEVVVPAPEAGPNSEAVPDQTRQ
jgi:hypothetical protein